MGKRLRPHTHSRPKPLIALGGKPILGYILDRLKDLKPDETILIVGYLGNQIREYVEENYSLPVTFVEQSEFQGLGHAIWQANDHVDDSPLLIILGDTIIDIDFSKWIGDSSKNILAVHQVDNPSRFGVVDLADDNSTIVNVVEKAEEPPTNLAIVGLYYFQSGTQLMTSLLELIDSGKKTRGEFQLTDAIGDLIEAGKPFIAKTVDGWYDCGDVPSTISTHRILLSQSPPGKPGDYHRLYPETVIVPPVHIHPTAHVVRAVVGPYVSIGEGTEVTDAVVRDSIIGSRARIDRIVITGSLIGDEVALEGKFESFNMGDHSEILRPNNTKM